MDDIQGEITRLEVLALEKLLGPTFDQVGEDLKDLYVNGIRNIAIAAWRKISSEDDGKRANLRVARDVFWNGSFTDESICAEYFGGILASSRSEDGKNDDCIQYVDIIKSLSAKQLHLHYIIYNSLNRLLVKKRRWINVKAESELKKECVCFFTEELKVTLKLNTSTDLNILFTKSLLREYKSSTHTTETGVSFNYTTVSPTTLGVLLYAVGHNKFNTWNHFSVEDLGDFQGIDTPKVYASSLEELSEKIHSKQ